MADHVFRHGSLGDLDTQFQKFAANPGYAPDGVLAAHDFESTHEFPSRLSAVLADRYEPSRSNTNGILDGANR
jgi:hypothetical protein